MTAYYNEIDSHAAQWIKNLISAGLVPAGDVDNRDVRDVRPADIAGYSQCHFFAGVAVWAAALRDAGWPDNKPVWTGSCPCQPFSAAGSRAGFSDERHLWPAWHHLIKVARPPIILGEQVASKNGYAWLDLVQADLEALDYACGPIVLPAAGFGAPHGRHRIWYVADANGGHAGAERKQRSGEQRQQPQDCGAGDVADTAHGDGRRRECGTQAGTWPDAERRRGLASRGAAGELAHTGGGQLSESVGRSEERDGVGPARKNDPNAPTNGFWFDADWINCSDEKWRAVEPGSFPLVDGADFRVGSRSTFEGKSRSGMLRGYGNAIVRQVAAEFVSAYMEIEQGMT